MASGREVKRKSLSVKISPRKEGQMRQKEDGGDTESYKTIWRAIWTLFIADGKVKSAKSKLTTFPFTRASLSTKEQS